MAQVQDESTTLRPAPYLLLVEDNPGDAQLTQLLLAEDGESSLPALRWVQSIEAAIQVLEAQAACQGILLDLGLPDVQGLATLQAVRPYAADCPIVVLTGDDSESVGLSAVVDGAQDYLVKGSFDAGLLRRCLMFAAHRKRAERLLLERALHDELTGLPRRALLLDRLQAAMTRAQRDHTEGSLLFIDLDFFKQINDTHGHAAGDAVLCAVGKRLLSSLRESDTAARLGGDEFAVLLPLTAGIDDALTVSQKVLAAVTQSLTFQGHVLTVGASMGAARFRDNGETAEQLMQRADAAMYAAKSAGRGTIRLL